MMASPQSTPTLDAQMVNDADNDTAGDTLANMETEAVAKAVAELEQTEIVQDESFVGGSNNLWVDIKDHWDSYKYNPHGRRDFAPPPGFDKISPESKLASVVSLYGSDLKRLFKGYTQIEGHKTNARASGGTFDDRLKAQNRLEVPALITLLRDFNLIAKQNQSRTQFLHLTDVSWVKRSFIPCISKIGHLPVSVDEVKRIVQKWRRRSVHNGMKEKMYFLEDIDMAGFIQILARVSLLGFRRLQAIQCNYDREAWSSAARRAFRLKNPPKIPKSSITNKTGNNTERFFWGLGSVSAKGFKILNPASRLWKTTQQKRRGEDVSGSPTNVAASSSDVIVCKVSDLYAPESESELMIETVATSINPYRDSDSMSRVMDDRRLQYRTLFELVDTDQSGLVERKELLDAVHLDEEIGDTLVDISPALAPLLQPEMFNAAFDAIDTDRDGNLSFVEFCAFLDAFETETLETQSNDLHLARYRSKIKRGNEIKGIFDTMNRTGKSCCCCCGRCCGHRCCCWQW